MDCHTGNVVRAPDSNFSTVSALCHLQGIGNCLLLTPDAKGPSYFETESRMPACSYPLQFISSNGTPPNKEYCNIVEQPRRKQRQDWCRWPVCEEFLSSGTCSSTRNGETDGTTCMLAHVRKSGGSHITVEGEVRVCFDSMGLTSFTCTRSDCHFYHPPKHIRDRIVARRHAQYLQERVFRTNFERINRAQLSRMRCPPLDGVLKPTCQGIRTVISCPSSNSTAHYWPTSMNIPTTQPLVAERNIISHDSTSPIQLAEPTFGQAPTPTSVNASSVIGCIPHADTSLVPSTFVDSSLGNLSFGVCAHSNQVNSFNFGSTAFQLPLSLNQISARLSTFQNMFYTSWLNSLFGAPTLRVQSSILNGYLPINMSAPHSVPFDPSGLRQSASIVW